jgi:hypothetical protein
VQILMLAIFCEAGMVDVVRRGGGAHSGGASCTRASVSAHGIQMMELIKSECLI